MLGVWLATWSALAAAPIHWDAPPACPDALGVQQDVARLLGDVEPTYAGVQVQGTVQATAEGFSLALRVETAQGTTERELSAPTCGPLSESAALYIAMAVDSLAVVAAEPTPPEPEPAPEPEPEPPPSAPPKRAEAAIDLDVGGGLDLGIYDALGGGPQLGLSGRVGPMRLGLRGRWTLWQPQEVAGSASGRARVTSFDGGVRACPTAVRGAFEVGGCAGLDVGLHRARGQSLQPSRDAQALSVSATAGPILGVWLASRVGIWVQPDLVLGLLRPRFVVDGLGDTLVMEPIGARVSMSVAVRLWSRDD
ncbi:MAG: hypothetical protein AAGA54_24980 [Myxococcota bacterium]